MNLKGHLKRRVNLKTFSSRIWSGAFAEMLGLEGGSWQPSTCRCFVLGKNLFIESGVEE